MEFMFINTSQFVNITMGNRFFPHVIDGFRNFLVFPLLAIDEIQDFFCPPAAGKTELWKVIYIRFRNQLTVFFPLWQIDKIWNFFQHIIDKISDFFPPPRLIFFLFCFTLGTDFRILYFISILPYFNLHFQTNSWISVDVLICAAGITTPLNFQSKGKELNMDD